MFPSIRVKVISSQPEQGGLEGNQAVYEGDFEVPRPGRPLSRQTVETELAVDPPRTWRPRISASQGQSVALMLPNLTSACTGPLAEKRFRNAMSPSIRPPRAVASNRRARRPVRSESSAGCAVTVSASILNPLAVLLLNGKPRQRDTERESKLCRVKPYLHLRLVFRQAESTSERTASEGIRSQAKRRRTARAKRT